MKQQAIIGAENLDELIKLLGNATKQAKQLKETLDQINGFKLKITSTFDD